MRYVQASPLELGYRIWQLRPPQPSLSVAVKGTFDPAARDPRSGAPAPFAAEPLPTHGEVHVDDDVERPLRQPSDLPLFKPKGECFVVGKAWAPHGKPTTAVQCGFSIGKVRRELVVFGDRRWGSGLVKRATAPEPFLSMDLSMDRAYGGPGFDDNPWGRGREEVDGALWLPNVEDPRRLVDSPSARPDPVVIGPYPMSWPARMRYTGTYDAAYMRERWPWLPADFDWRFYLAAPPEQQLRQGFWRGDEPVAFEGLHPSAPSVRARLPGIRPRLCASFADGRFVEGPTVLDTVVWDAEVGRLICVWRGMFEVPSETLEELDYLFVAHDPLDGPHRAVDALRAEMERLLAEEDAEEQEAEGEPPPAADASPPAAGEDEGADAEDGSNEDDADAGGDEGEQDEAPDPMEAELEAKMAEVQAQLKALGIEPPSEAAPPPEPADPKALLERLRASGADVPPELAQMVEELDQPEPEEAEEPEPPPVEPPPAPEGRALVEARLAAGEPLRELDLTGVDLRGLDLAGQDLSESVLRGADLTAVPLLGATLAGATLAAASLGGASLDGADLRAADLAGATLDGASLREAQLAEADLEGASLRGADLEGARASGASWIGADLEQARLRGGDFTEGDFTGAQLVAVAAEEATFTDATFEEARADRGVFHRAVMGGLRAEGLRAEEAHFGSIRADDSFWEGATLSRADFSFAELARADFSDAVLIGAEMDGCALAQARFERANAHSLRARKADLFEAVFESADLSFADLRGANLFGAELWRANTSRAQLALANLERTKLA